MFKYVYKVREQDYLKIMIDVDKRAIEKLEERVKELDFLHYLRTGKFPVYMKDTVDRHK